MKIKNIFVVLLMFWSVFASSQIAPNKYVIFFTTKEGTPFSIDNPSEYLSNRAIQRRLKQNIDICEDDLPVNPAFCDSVSSVGAKILYTSRWFNFVVVSASESQINKINFPFVKSVKHNLIDKLEKQDNKFEKAPGFEKRNITNDDNQFVLSQINLLPLMQMGYDATGIRIAVIDAGFWHLNECDGLKQLISNNKIIATKNFVKDTSVYESFFHGTAVTSIMAGKTDSFTGSATGAEYVFIQSEDAGSEYLVEEYNWVAAAEFADSIGADVINSSLGYTQFDWPAQNHTIQDLDGSTSIISRAAGIAFSKGIIVVNSAGNSGNTSWRYISVPADQPKILTVGSVNADGDLSDFSSIGTSQNMYKPDLVACGEGTKYIYNSSVHTGNGTSYSSPLIAGAVASLWQAFPDKTNSQVVDAVRQSCPDYPDGDNYTGYGIPDFFKAYFLLEGAPYVPTQFDKQELLNMYSTKQHDLNLYIYSPNDEIAEVNIFDLQQRLVNYVKINLHRNDITHSEIGGLSCLQGNIAIVSIKTKHETFIKKVFIF